MEYLEIVKDPAGHMGQNRNLPPDLKTKAR